jgi:hypothetical protein
VLSRMRAALLTGVLAMGGVALVATPAHADEPNCSSNRDWTYNWAAYSICTNRAHRVIISCHTQSRGNVYAYGPWSNPNQRSLGICPGDTNRINYYGADYPD